MRTKYMFIVLATLLALNPCWAAAQEGKEPPAMLPTATDDSLWQDATAAAGDERWAEAASLFQRLYDQFPKSPKAEDALWEAARLYKKAADLSVEPEWEKVRNLFRLYAAQYPKSPRSVEAYFEIGVAHYRMRFFREALTYFKLFQERYPQAPLIPTVRLWQGKTLMEVGRVDEAIFVFRKVAEVEDQTLRIQALIGLGQAYDAKKDYPKALEAFEGIMAKYPHYFLEDHEYLVHLGTAYFKVGKEAEGQKQLFYYINIAPQSPRLAEVLFELGESFHRQGEEATAQKLYAKVTEGGEPGERAMVLAHFRQMQYLDDPQRKLPAWQKRRDLTDTGGDLPYLAVLDSFRDEPIAQDARYGLFLRYRARDNHEFAAEMGRSFLRYDTPGKKPHESHDVGGEVMTYLVEEMLKREQYQKIYELYQAEYQHVAQYDQGRLRYLIGQALEAMGLYDQAAVVYYRALAHPLTDEEKIDLYHRRAHVYLQQKDLASAERLLEYLRKIYADTSEIGEICYYSGLLREAQKRYAEALAFYDQAAKGVVAAEKKPLYGEARLRMLLAAKRFSEMLVALDGYRKEGWLTLAALQQWYRKVGDVLRRENKTDETLNAYLAAVGENMPQEGGAAQAVHLQLGDLLVQLGDFDKGREHFKKARDGSDPFLKKVAEERLNQADIDQSLTVLKPLLGNS